MRLAIIVSHPIQYYSPWFRHIAEAMRREAVGMRREEECGKVGKWEGGKAETRDEETKRQPEVGGPRPETGDRLHGNQLIKDQEPSEARRREAKPRANQETESEPEIGGHDTLHDTSNSQRNALRVFYLWDFGVTEQTDKGFGKTVKWDVDLLEGYDHEFVPNVSKRPGTDWFGGLDNPELLQRVKEFAPDAVLQFGYNYKSLVNFDLRWNTKRAPLLFRGDSHLLAESEQSWQSSVVSWQRERGERQEAGVAGKEFKRRKDEETGKETESKIREAMGARFKWWMRDIGLRLLFRRFACFLAVGKANADYFRAHGVPENKIVRCPHVVDNEFFRREPEETRGPRDQETAGGRRPETGDRRQVAWQPTDKRPKDAPSRGLRVELGIPEDELVFLFAGKLEEKKQPMQLLEAFLAADLPGATLVFVGSGELECALKERAFGSSQSSVVSSQIKKTEDCKLHTANSRGNVVFLEFQNQSRMPDVYRTGDVLVLPSKGRYETWGLAVNEAACCGLPAIVSSHVGCGPDLIEENVTGWVFAAGDPAELSRTLQSAAAARNHLHAMGCKLRTKVSADFSYQSATAALMDAAECVTHRHRAFAASPCGV